MTAAQCLPALPICHLWLKGSRPIHPGYPNTLKTLGDHFRKRRLDLGLLQREVAEKLGVKPSTITNLEGNATTPTCRYTKAILDFLGYNLYPPAKNLAERLILYRKTQGLSQRQFSKRLRIDQKTLAAWELGKHRPTKKSLVAVEKFLVV